MGAVARAAADDGFSDDEIERIFDHVPVATHNQRGLGTLHIGFPEGADAEIEARTLLDIVEGSMSSEIYELMKRTDEAAVVEKAHRRPRFVEDCVREMIGGVVAELTDLSDEHFVSARQENLETIHQHNVVCERFGLLGELRHELATGEHAGHQTSMREWLDARPLSGRLRAGRSTRGGGLAPRLGLAQHAPQAEEVVDAADDRDRDRAVDERRRPTPATGGRSR